MSTMGLWTQISNDSWVKVWVEEAGGDLNPGFTADGVFHHDTGGADDRLTGLHGQPSRRKLSTPTNYTIRVTIAFAKRSTAFVVAEVTDRHGQPVAEAFTGGVQFRSSPITANGGSARSVTLFFVTKTGPGGGVS